VCTGDSICTDCGSCKPACHHRDTGVDDAEKNELAGKQEDDGWHVDRSSLQCCDKPQASDIVKPGCGGGCGGCGGH